MRRDTYPPATYHLGDAPRSRVFLQRGLELLASLPDPFRGRAFALSMHGEKCTAWQDAGRVPGAYRSRIEVLDLIEFARVQSPVVIEHPGGVSLAALEPFEFEESTRFRRPTTFVLWDHPAGGDRWEDWRPIVAWSVGEGFVVAPGGRLSFAAKGQVLFTVSASGCGMGGAPSGGAPGSIPHG